MCQRTKLAAIIILASCYVTFLGMFIIMYLSPQRTMFFGIDVYGEANLEAVILLLTFPVCVKYLLEQYKSL